MLKLKSVFSSAAACRAYSIGDMALCMSANFFSNRFVSLSQNDTRAPQYTKTMKQILEILMLKFLGNLTFIIGMCGKLKFGWDSIFKNRTVQKFDIRSDGFLTETACNLPFK